MRRTRINGQETGIDDHMNGSTERTAGKIRRQGKTWNGNVNQGGNRSAGILTGDTIREASKKEGGGKYRSGTFVSMVTRTPEERIRTHHAMRQRVDGVNRTGRAFRKT